MRARGTRTPDHLVRSHTDQFNISTGTVTCYACRVRKKGGLDDLAGIDAGPVDGAVEDFIELDDAVAVVEPRQSEDLMLAPGQVAPAKSGGM